MTEIDLVWLVDLDPPSDFGGGKGFYPQSRRTDPPDEKLMHERAEAVLSVVVNETGGQAAVTVHTSPRHRRALLEGSYPDLWHRFVQAGTGLALHPHEERADGSTCYDDRGHMEGVIAGSVALAARQDLVFSAFRSGTFAFHPDIPVMLAAHDIGVDLSAAPTLKDPQRGIAWDADTARPDIFLSRGTPVLEIPIGWNGKGNDLNRDYLFNERMDFAALTRVWDDMRRRAADADHSLVANFLCHGFGLREPAWRQQAIEFLRHASRHGGRIIGIDSAKSRTLTSTTI